MEEGTGKVIPNVSWSEFILKDFFARGYDAEDLLFVSAPAKALGSAESNLIDSLGPVEGPL